MSLVGYSLLAVQVGTIGRTFRGRVESRLARKTGSLWREIQAEETVAVLNPTRMCSLAFVRMLLEIPVGVAAKRLRSQSHNCSCVN